MKKFPKPWYRPSRGLWYVTLNGVQHSLGLDKDTAFAQYRRLLGQSGQVAVSCHAVAPIVDAFLDWSQKHQAERTYFRYRDYCQSFINLFPDLLVAELKPFHIQEWVDSQSGWGNTTKRSAIVAIQRAFNWAEKQGRISINPIRHAEKPTADKREAFITHAEHERILKLIKLQEFRDLVVLA